MIRRNRYHLIYTPNEVQEENSIDIPEDAETPEDENNEPQNPQHEQAQGEPHRATTLTRTRRRIVPPNRLIENY